MDKGASAQRGLWRNELHVEERAWMAAGLGAMMVGFVRVGHVGITFPLPSRYAWGWLVGMTGFEVGVW